MKKLTVCLILTLLFALSVSATSFKFYLYGNAITKYGNSSRASFFVTLKGIQDTGILKKPVNILDTVNDSLIIQSQLRAAISCSLVITIKKQGFLIDRSNRDTVKCDSFSWNTGALFSANNYVIAPFVIEKCPKIITNLNYTGSLLQWGTNPLTIVDSQSLWVSRNNGLTYIRLDSLNILTPTQNSYLWIPPSSGGAIIKIKTLNADSSDSSSYIYYSTKIIPVNKAIIYSTPQKSSIFNIQGQLIYKGILDQRLFKFSSGEYFTANKIQLLLH